MALIIVFNSVVKPTYNELVASPCVYTYVYTLCVKVILYLHVYSNDCIDPHQINNEKCDYPLLVVKYVSLFWVFTILDQIRDISVCVCLCICSYLIIYICACVCENPEKIQKSFTTHGIGFAFSILFGWYVIYNYIYKCKY